MNRKQNPRPPADRGKLLIAALVIACLAGAIVRSWSRSSAGSLARIRDLGQRDPAAALKLLDAKQERSRDAKLLRCHLLAATGRWEEAERAFDEIGKPEFFRQDELVPLASVALAAGVYSLADKVMDADYRRGDPDPRLLRAMIDVKHQLGADREALPLCEELSKLAPRDPYPWLRSAQMYHQAEKIDLAIGAYREVLLRNPDRRDERQARFQIADLAIYAGDLDTAGQQLDQLAAQLPEDPDVGLLRAKLLHRRGDFDASLQVLDAVLAARPDLVAGWLERGALHLEREDWARAVRDLKQAVALAPENYTGHYQLGLAYQRLNEPQLAQQHLQRSSQITERIAAEKARAEERRRASAK